MEWMKKIMEFFAQVLQNYRAQEEQPELRKKVIANNIVEMGVREKDREIKWKKSPNYSVRSNREISAIILHHTASWNLENTVDWMCDPAAKASAHYCIGRDGTIIQMVFDQHVAWHAGKSSLEGRPHVNNYSVGIEMVGNTCEKPLTDEQWEAMVWLVKRLMEKYDIPPHRVVDHRKISPGRKVDLDPANFDWIKFYADID